jgi:hypothetical protein
MRLVLKARNTLNSLIEEYTQHVLLTRLRHVSQVRDSSITCEIKG